MSTENKADSAPPDIFQSASIVSKLTGLSRILGFLREILMANFFGTSLAKSAFDLAFKIPNLFRRLFGEGALSAAFVPIFSETIEKEGREAAQKLAGKITTMLATALLSICVVGFLIISILINNADLGEKATAVFPLLLIMLPYMFLICLVALSMGILNTVHHFALPAATPVILNLVWIASLFFLCPLFGNDLNTRIYGVAYGIIIAGIIQLLVQIPILLKLNVWPKLSFSWGDKRVSRILLLMGPAAIGMGIHQINVVIDGVLALWVGTWAPAALTYAERLIYLPLGLFATALGTVLLPAFSRHAARNDTTEMKKTTASSIRGLMLIMMPAAAGLIVLASPIVRLAFQWGEFDAESTIVTARALSFYAPGLIVFSLYKILTPAFYALKDTKTPVKIGIWAVAINFILNVVFILTWPQGYKHAGLACATVIASGINCLALGMILTRRIGSPGWVSISVSSLRTLTASAIMAGIAFLSHKILLNLAIKITTQPKLQQLTATTGAIFIAIAAYILAATLLCRSEVKEILGRSRFKVH